MCDYLCPMCFGFGLPLGLLADTEYFRCRDCGATFSSPETSKVI